MGSAREVVKEEEEEEEVGRSYTVPFVCLESVWSLDANFGESGRRGVGRLV